MSDNGKEPAHPVVAQFDVYAHGLTKREVAAIAAMQGLLATGDVRKLRRSIRKCLRNGGGTIAGAINYSHDELDRAMAEYHARNHDE